MKNFRLVKISALVLVVFVILGCAAVLTVKPDWRYMMLEIIRKPDDDLLPRKLSAEAFDMKKYTYEEMFSDSRFELEDCLMLINEEYTLSDGYAPCLSEYGETGQKMNLEILDSFNELVTAVKKNCGQDLLIMSGYRNAEEQSRTIVEEGNNAAEVNASEHLTGLSLDVCVQYFGGNAFLKSKAGRFVNSYCGDYGFIIRYPMFSKDITGIGYEPWHIRYVGLPHSKIIQGAKLTFEEYINYFEIGEFYGFEDHIITRQTKDDIKLPENFQSARVSEDNTGCYIITIEK